jgi:aminoglycoside phosphotransferase (APT) family kinase protein
MPEFVLGHTRQWLDHFSRQGYSPTPLAAGSEGAVYDLGDGLVSKVWRERRLGELERMQGFYVDVAAAQMPFATPEILSIERVDGTPVTYERKLPGKPLQNRLGRTDREIDQIAVKCVAEVLTALANVPATAGMRDLPVLDENQPLWAGADTFQVALADLIERRARRFGPVIREHLPDFDERREALLAKIGSVESRSDTVIHGDLFGENILIDERNRPAAVLDFGFLTTAGDPRFDVAIAASIMNMYGPHALSITRDLTSRLARDLEYSYETLLTYQAAYAAVTSNAFTLDGSDGHFSWCIAQLRRPEISEILGL